MKKKMDQIKHNLCSTTKGEKTNLKSGEIWFADSW